MQIILKNKKKVATNFPRNVLKRKNIIEEIASSLGVKREQESTHLRAQKMMKGKVEPFVVPTMVREMPIEVHVVKQTTIVPHMTSP